VKRITFSQHAELKFVLLESHGFPLEKEIIITTLMKPDKIDSGYKGRKIAQRRLDSDHVLRVVFEELSDEIRVITFYPGKRGRYETQI